MSDKEALTIGDWGRIITAGFVRRPNRFLVHASLGKGREVKAFLPNPGRLHELLLPDAKLYLAPNRKRSASTDYTAMAVERDGRPVFLHTHYTNRVAGRLIELGLAPGMEGARIIRAEIPHGRSRFDFLLERAGKEMYLEVKSCTLFGNGVAMFPDAVTERGKRHLVELEALSQKGTEVAVMFVIHHAGIKWFMPDFHTDLAFSRKLLDVRHRVRALPVSVEWTQSLKLKPNVKRVKIPWEHIDREARDGGAYILLLHLKRNRSIEVGSLGKVTFEKGWHIYVGSAIKNLDARINRHVRIRKRMHWHIDPLRAVSDEVTALPLRSSSRLECNIASELAEAFVRGPEGFGSSDCKCPRHLFFSRQRPLDLRKFHEILQKFRMRPPTGELK